MNKIERIKLVRAMEYIARQVNDEEVFEEWLLDGVADGDIEYSDLSVHDEDLNEEDPWDGLGYYIKDDDNTFKSTMTTFLRVMAGAWKSGGLYCDGITSDERSDRRAE